MFSKQLDPLKRPPFPGVVGDFFGSIFPANFVQEITDLLNNEDCSTTEGVCMVEFEENFDPVEWELNPGNNRYYPFSGVRFSFRVISKDPLEATFLTREQFCECLLAFCRYFVSKHPEFREWTDKAMQEHGFNDKWTEWMKP